MITRDIEVRQTVRVTVDETKFTPEFLAEFHGSFFRIDTVEEHLMHIAQLIARGVVEIGETQSEFIEGYGRARDFGISGRAISCSEDIVVEDDGDDDGDA